MNRQVTSREAILAQCRAIVSESGPSLNIREVAARCGVASGSIYNYFPSKEALVSAVTESVWADIFSPAGAKAGGGFAEYVSALYGGAAANAVKYPGFFAAHSMSFRPEERGSARAVMEGSLARVRGGLLTALEADGSISADAFGPDLTREELADLCLSAMIGCLLRGEPDCKPLESLLRRAIH